MKVRKISNRGAPNNDYVIYSIYDETKIEPYLPLEDYAQGKGPAQPIPVDLNCSPLEFWNKVKKSLIEWRKDSDGVAFERPVLCYFTCHDTGKIEFEFDSEHQYSLDELNGLVRKARRAANRINWSKTAA